MNPLDSNDTLSIELMNPNPTSSKTKSGPVYRVSFEVQRDVWDCFMDAETAGMVLEGVVRVTARNEPVAAPEKPKGGVVSKAAAMLCTDTQANQFAEEQGYADLKDMIYKLCEIGSRAELDHNKDAALAYEKIKSAFLQWAY